MAFTVRESASPCPVGWAVRSTATASSAGCERPSTATASCCWIRRPTTSLIARAGLAAAADAQDFDWLCGQVEELLQAVDS